MRLRHLSLLALFPLSLLCSACARGEHPQADQFQYPSTGGSGGSGVGGSGGPQPDGGAECGNGVREPGEDCDMGDLGGRTCMTEGFGSGGLLCSPLCIFDTTHCTTCGNGTLDAEEECDGTDFGGKTSCADISAGAATEPLICSDACTIDLSNCSGCGDGVISSPEDCEPGYGPDGKPDLGGQTCAGLGFDGGDLDCNKSCRFDETGCYTCGDASRNGVEECDGADFGGKGCNDFPSASGDPFTSGSLACSSSCTIDTSHCMLCGDGVVSGNEACDIGTLGGRTCESEGFTGGVLQCSIGCKTFDTSKCSLCGNSQVEGSEQCDGPNLNGATCQSLGFAAGGSLSCSSDCKFDTATCSNNTCGDGVINGNDACDCGSSGSSCASAQLDGKSCSSFTSPANTPYAGGTLRCSSPSNCQFDLSACTYCGDGIRNGAEQCDGQDLGGASCTSRGFSSGSLKCSTTCSFDESACVLVPNPLVVCSSPGLTIADYDLNGVSDVISIPSSGTITDVNVQIVATHGWVGDLYFDISHGSTLYSVLIDQPGVPASTYGCDGNDVDATLDDQASAAVEDTCGLTTPSLSGSLRPDDPLSSFNGQSMSGDWELFGADLAGGFSGVLVKWCVAVSWQ